MDHKIPGNYYLVYVPGDNESDHEITQYCLDEHKGPMWIDREGFDITDLVKSYKTLDKVGKMRPFAVLTIPSFK